MLGQEYAHWFYYLLSASFLFVGFSILVANRNRATHRAVALLLISMSIWAVIAGFIYAGWDVAGNFYRAAVASGGLVIPWLWILRLTMVHPQAEFGVLLRRGIPAFVAAAIYVLLVFSPWFIPYESTADNKLSGPLRFILPYVPAIPLLGILSAISLDRRKLIGVRRYEATFVVVAFVICVSLLLIRNAARDFLPYAGSNYWSGAIAALFLGSILYGIMGRRILDARSLLLGAVSLFVTCCITIGAVLLINYLMDGAGNSTAFASLLGAAVAIPTWKLSQRIVPNLFESTSDKPLQRALQEFETLPSGHTSVTEGLIRIEHVVVGFQTCNRCQAFIKIDGLWLGRGVNAPVPQQVVDSLQDVRWATRYSLERAWKFQSNRPLADWIEEHGAEVVVMSATQPSVILLLAQRNDGRAYSFRDINQLFSVAEASGETLKQIHLNRKSLEAGKLGALPVVAAGLAHDLKQYSASAKFFTKLLENSDDPKQVLDKHLTHFNDHLDQFTVLAAQLSDLGRTEAPDLSLTNLPTLIESLINELNRTAGGPRLEFHLPDETDFPMVSTDSHQLARGFRNLCLNACEAVFHQDDGQISVTLSKTEQVVIIGIEDNGPGLPEAVKEHLFEPFADSTKPDGSGLGLYLAWDSIHKAGGTLIHDESFETGTRFLIRLPLD